MKNYTKQGDYNLPNITLPEQKEAHIGVWAQRYANYMKANHKVLYYNMLTSCTLYDKLAEIEEQAETMFQSIVKSLSEKENITENLKATDPMKWTKAMNNICNRATEFVYTELIYI